MWYVYSPPGCILTDWHCVKNPKILPTILEHAIIFIRHRLCELIQSMNTEIIMGGRL